MNQAPVPSKPKRNYFAARSHLLYYVYIDRIVRGLAADAHSILDVGSHNASYLEAFDWIPERHTLDLRRPYSSENVRGIVANFFEFVPEEKYDFVTCFQVLEHIKDAGAFAGKLMQTSDRVLVSVPFKWPEGSSKHHVQDPVDLDKLAGWFGRRPDYHVIVTEPLNNSKKSKRLIAYFHNAGPMPRLIDFRRCMEELLKHDQSDHKISHDLAGSKR